MRKEGRNKCNWKGNKEGGQEQVKLKSKRRKSTETSVIEKEIREEDRNKCNWKGMRKKDRNYCNWKGNEGTGQEQV